MTDLLAERLRQHKARLAPLAKFRRLGIREPGNRKTVLARQNSGELARPRGRKSRDRPDRLAHVPTQPFNVTSCARCRSQGAAGTLATCRCSNDYEHLHAGRSECAARGEQQSRSLSAPCASRLALMAPCGPSKSHKLFSMKEMLVGAVGIEPTTFGLKGRCSTTELRP